MFTSEKKEYFTVPPLTFRQEVILALCNNIEWTYRYNLNDEGRAKLIVDFADEIVRKAE